MTRLIRLGLLVVALIIVEACTILPIDKATPTPTLIPQTPTSDESPTFVEKLVEFVIPVKPLGQVFLLEKQSVRLPQPLPLPQR